MSSPVGKAIYRGLKHEVAMPVRITCPHCHQDLRLPDHLYAGPAQCPRCGGGFAIEWPGHSGHEQPSAEPRQGVTLDELRRPCRFCGRAIPLGVAKCPACGQRLRG
jgi:hypothetical protein